MYVPLPLSVDRNLKYSKHNLIRKFIFFCFWLLKVHFVRGTLIIPGLECFESWVRYSQEYTSVFKALFWPYHLVQLEPEEPGSAVTIVLGQETRLRKSNYLSLVEAGGTTLMFLCRLPAGSTSGTNIGRGKTFQWMMWKQGSLVAITSDSKKTSWPYSLRESLGKCPLVNVHEQLLSHRPSLIEMDCPKFSFFKAIFSLGLSVCYLNETEITKGLKP